MGGGSGYGQDMPRFFMRFVEVGYFGLFHFLGAKGLEFSVIRTGLQYISMAVWFIGFWIGLVRVVRFIRRSDNSAS